MCGESRCNIAWVHFDKSNCFVTSGFKVQAEFPQCFGGCNLISTSLLTFTSRKVRMTFKLKWVWSGWWRWWAQVMWFECCWGKLTALIPNQSSPCSWQSPGAPLRLTHPLSTSHEPECFFNANKHVHRMRTLKALFSAWEIGPPASHNTSPMTLHPTLLKLTSFFYWSWTCQSAY